MSIQHATILLDDGSTIIINQFADVSHSGKSTRLELWHKDKLTNIRETRVPLSFNMLHAFANGDV